MHSDEMKMKITFTIREESTTAEEEDHRVDETVGGGEYLDRQKGESFTKDQGSVVEELELNKKPLESSPAAVGVELLRASGGIVDPCGMLFEPAMPHQLNLAEGSGGATRELEMHFQPTNDSS
jgi:hypothetical protein